MSPPFALLSRRLMQRVIRSAPRSHLAVAPRRRSPLSSTARPRQSRRSAARDYAKWEDARRRARSRPTASGSRTTSAAATGRTELHYRAVDGDGAHGPLGERRRSSRATIAGCCYTITPDTAGGRGGAGRPVAAAARGGGRRRGERGGESQQGRRRSICAPARTTTFDDIQIVSR